MTKEILSMKSENHEGNFRKALYLIYYVLSIGFYFRKSVQIQAKYWAIMYKIQGIILENMSRIKVGELVSDSWGIMCGAKN